MIKALLILSFFILTTAHSAIIFLDLNDSESEVAEVEELAEKRAAAQRRGEKVIIIPKDGDSDDIATQLRRVLFAESFSFDNDPVTDLVISGHYAEQKFSGTKNGRDYNITFSEFSSIMNSDRGRVVRDSIEKVMLWGCYTARPRAIAHWQELLPNTQLLAGFNFAAPNSNTIASPRILRNLLQVSDNDINQNRIVSRVRDFVNFTERGERFYDLFSMTNLSVVVNGCYMSSRIGNMTAERIPECPASLLEALLQRKENSFDHFINPTKSESELFEQARNHGPRGLYRFRQDSIQYENCFTQSRRGGRPVSQQLPTLEEINDLCTRWNCTD